MKLAVTLVACLASTAFAQDDLIKPHVENHPGFDMEAPPFKLKSTPDTDCDIFYDKCLTECMCSPLSMAETGCEPRLDCTTLVDASNGACPGGDNPNSDAKCCKPYPPYAADLQAFGPAGNNTCDSFCEFAKFDEWRVGRDDDFNGPERCSCSGAFIARKCVPLYLLMACLAAGALITILFARWMLSEKSDFPDPPAAAGCHSIQSRKAKGKELMKQNGGQQQQQQAAMGAMGGASSSSSGGMPGAMPGAMPGGMPGAFP